MLIMPDSKQMCKKCKVRHVPPTGKKCQRMLGNQDQELLNDAAISSGARKKNAPDGQLLQCETLNQLECVNRRLDQVEDSKSGTALEKTQKLSNCEK